MEGDIKGEMSPEAPETSPLEQAKLEANELHSKVRRDLDSLRTAPINEFGNRIDRLQEAVKLSQDYVIRNIGQALEFSDSRIHDLENNLGARQMQLIDTERELQVARAQAASATAKGQDAIAKYQEAKSDFDTAELELKTLRSKMEDAEEEVFRLGQQCAETREELDAAEGQKADLQTDLKAIKERALAAENEAKDFKSRLIQINDITALVSSSKRQPHAAQRTSSSSPSPTRQGSAGESIDGSQPQDHHTRSERLDSHMNNAMSDPESDLLLCQIVLDEVMDEKHRHYNQHFLKRLDPADPNVHSPINVKTCPVDLDTMKGKLATGAYTSFKLFKADFYLMIVCCQRLEPPNSPLCIAAEALLTIFQQTWSAQRISSRQSPKNASSTQGASSKKRKASTEGPVSSEGDQMAKKPRECIPYNHDAARPANPVADGGLHPASSQSGQVPGSSRISAGFDTSVWQGPLTTGPGISVNSAFDAVVKRVSAVKPGNTCNNWKSLLPYNLYVTANALPETVEGELFALNFDLTGDMITRRLEPNSGSDTSAFDRLFNYLVSRERYATVSYQRNDHVRKIYLVPTLQKTRYPDFIPGLDHAMLPTVQTMNVMLMVIVHHVLPKNREPVRKAWNHIVQAVNSPDMSDFAGIRDHLIHHPLPVYFPRIAAVFGGELYIDQMLRTLCQPQENGGAKLADFPRSLLRLSYRELDQSGPAVIDGVQLPEAVFILGAVVSNAGKCYELLVVDIQNGNRSLWAISERKYSPGQSSTAMTLLRSKFPKSWHEWEDVMVNDLRDTQSKKQLKDTGLQIERF